MHRKLLFTLSLAVISLTSSPLLADSKESVRIVIPEAPDTLDPCHSERSDVGRIIKQNVVESLVEFDPAEGKLKPRLAEKWEQTSPTTWRFTLRPNVKFHDGAALNADAVAFGIKRTLNPKLTCDAGVKFFGGVNITTTKIDDLTIEIGADTPQPILPLMLSVVTLVSPSTPLDEAIREPAGTGPYKLAGWDPTRDIKLEQYADYWGAKPQVKQATYVWRAEASVRAASVSTGEADIALGIAAQDASNKKTDFSYPTSETTEIRILPFAAPLNDIRVRKALNLAVDRNAFVGTILSSGVQPASQLVVSTINGYNHDLKVWPYDPEQAKKLIDEARAAGVPVDREIVLLGRIGLIPNGGEMLEALIQMWQQVGLNIKLQMAETGQWQKLATKPYAADRPPTLVQTMHDNNTGDAIFTVYNRYGSQAVRSDTNDAQVDDLIKRARETVNPERKQLFEQVFRRVTEDIVPEVILFHMVDYIRIAEGIDFRPTVATNSELQLSQIGLKP